MKVNLSQIYKINSLSQINTYHALPLAVARVQNTPESSLESRGPGLMLKRGVNFEDMYIFAKIFDP